MKEESEEPRGEAASDCLLSSFILPPSSFLRSHDQRRIFWITLPYTSVSRKRRPLYLNVSFV
jgi:hypothetical protein